jgi:hypothetical protein
MEEAMRVVACSQDSKGYSLTSEQQLLAGLQNKSGRSGSLDRAGMFRAAGMGKQGHSCVLVRSCTNAITAEYSCHVT